ncbi:MAG: TrbI/VirB10 family protein [Alphaproteobacteria bacterium]
MSNNDDLDNDEFEDDGFDEFDDSEQSSGTLGELVHSNPLVKVGIVLGAAALIFGTIILFGGEEEKATFSSVGAPAEITATPGTEEASPAYIEAVQDVNQQNYEQAIREQESAIPIPIEPPVGRITVQQEEESEEDPLQRWRRLQQERLERELEQRQVIEPTALPENNGQQEQINALAEAMSAQMQAVLENQGGYTISSMAFTNESAFFEALYGEDEEGVEGEDGELVGELSEEEIQEMIIVPAGEIEYGQIITEANSDIPGPVLAEIASGPLSGSRMLGEFSTENEMITLTFRTIVIDGQSYPINAIALDPATTLTGMATDVDHRYFQRIVLPAAAAFIEGAATAIAESGRTNVTIQGDTVAEETEETDTEQEIASGIEEAGAAIQEIIEEMNEDTEPLVIVASGTPMGILFLEPVTMPIDETDF